jgi:hypothetical protein
MRPPSLLLCRRLFSSTTTTATTDVLAQASRDLQRSITPAVAACLARNGAAVIDGAFSQSVTRPLLAEFHALRRSSPHLLRPNCTHFVDAATGATTLLEKPGILEAEATLDAEARARLPLWSALSDSSDLRALLSVHLGHALEQRWGERRRRGTGSTPAPHPPLRLDAQTIKLQRNDGALGGCFPVHCDAAEDLAGEGRVVTCILYLSDSTGYDPARHGGQLRLYPLRPPLSAAAASPPPPVSADVEPREGRLVLFASARMPHRVLPATGGRVRECATFWVGRSANGGWRGPAAAADATSPSSSLEERLRLLLSPRYRPLAARLLLADEWEQSLIESHAPGPERDAAVATHRRALAAARAAVERAGLEEAVAALAGGAGSGSSSPAAAAAAAAAATAAEDMDWF